MPLMATTGFPASLDQDRNFAAEAEVVQFGHAGRQHRGDARIHRVAARGQDAYAGIDFEVVAAPTIS